MRSILKRLVATVMAAVVFASPVKAWADMDPSASAACSTYRQVESNATGGDYVGGILFYETEGTVSRTQPSTTTTSTTSSTATLGAGGSGASTTVTTTTTTTQPGNTTTTKEPIGFYAMNDGSIYEINCVTGESKKVA
ncbi:MAG TPA: hypothetical protein VE967_08010 [Gemmatimonadaceae bacterium]|nr:hypothetical protein [Gemmatimonadaceae bacterium]